MIFDGHIEIYDNFSLGLIVPGDLQKISTAKFNTVSNVILSYSGFVLIRFAACREKNCAAFLTN